MLEAASKLQIDGLVALILHNLSFEKNNVPVLVRNKNFIRFILLCSHTTWANLKQTAYDTLANLACEIKLSIEKDTCSRILFQTVMDGIQSPDRYMNIRSMDILSQLCNYPSNEDIIPSRVDVEVYQKMVSFLTVHDIMLLFYTLEALYALSDLGRYACDKIVCVHRCIGVLVSLLTVDPSQYGSAGCIKMKIVETMIPYEVQDHANSNPAAVCGTESQTPVTPSQATNPDVDSETFASNWLKSTYEAASGMMVSRNEIFAEYVSFCGKSGRKAVVNANVFAGIVKNLFPQCSVKKVESGNGVITFHHDGLQRKRSSSSQANHLSKPINNLVSPLKVPAPVTPTSCKPGQKLSHSPILKAQLSAPPRPGGTTPPPNHPQNVSNGQKCVSPPHVPASSQNTIIQTPTTSGNSSNLIKSLLANKVQQRNLQRQVVPANVSKMVIFTPDKVAVGQTIVNSPNTVVRCIRPGTLSQINLRAPLQARFIANKGCIIPATPANVIKSTILAPKVQATLIKPTVVAATTPRLNGVQRDIQMEVCSQDEDSKSSGEVTYTQVKQMNCLQNYLNSDSSFDTKDSVSCDGDSLLSLKDAETDSEKNFVFHHITDNSVSNTITLKHELNSCDNILILKPKLPMDALSFPKEQNGPSNTFVNNAFESISTSQPKNNSSSSILKCVLNELESENEDITNLQQLQKDKICKKAPLLNGLLDKGKLTFSNELISETLMQNGNMSNPPLELKYTETKPTTTVQLFSNQCNLPVTSNSVVSLSSSVHSAISPPLSSAVVSSPNTVSPSFSNSISSGSTSTILPSTAFHSNGDNLMQICTGQTTLSGTIEVQPDQKGVVRLHIESPENSNQGSDLSSITDIARTLECASQAISRTNAECNTQVPYCGTCETTATVTVITTNTSTLARTGQQIIMVTPTLNQSQLHIQSPNIKFRILSLPKPEESVSLIGLSQGNTSNIKISLPETPSNMTSTLKRPSSEVSPPSVDAKKTRIDTKTPLLEASLRLSTPVPLSTATSTTAKLIPESQSFLLKPTQMENLASASKLTYAKAIPVQNVDLPNEKEDKTFSGLSSASDNPSLTAPSQVPPRSMSSGKLEYLCEWKDCGLKFPNPGSVFLHASKVHTPYCKDDMICQWDGCDLMKRRRFSLLTHLQDWHCNERVLHIQALRRKQISQQGKTSIAPPQMPPLHPGYAPDAALLAIRRHALQYINPKELSEEKESALTKSIRLTSALILRNLVTHSSLARTYIKRFEQELAYLAMSPVESARTIAQCLSELSRSQD